MKGYKEYEGVCRIQRGIKGMKGYKGLLRYVGPLESAQDSSTHNSNYPSRNPNEIQHVYLVDDNNRHIMRCHTHFRCMVISEL